MVSKNVEIQHSCFAVFVPPSFDKIVNLLQFCLCYDSILFHIIFIIQPARKARQLACFGAGCYSEMATSLAGEN